MSSFIFNEFKKRYLNGEVKNEGAKWTFTPVKKDFIDKLRCRNGNLEISMSMQDNTVMEL